MKIAGIPLAAAAAATALVLAAAPVAAQTRPVELRFAHWLPPTHPLSKLGFEP